MVYETNSGEASEATGCLLLVDGHSLAFRAFYGTKLTDRHRSAQGPVNALYGFISRFLSAWGYDQHTHVAVSFDLSRTSFRTRIYPEYKAGRKETPEDFQSQMPLIRRFLELCGVQQITREDYEADDVIATLAKRFTSARVNVLSGDRDLIQLVNERVNLVFLTVGHHLGLLRYTPEVVEERYGLRPENYPDLAALVGESSDNLPGIPRVGEKTALRLLREHGGLNQVIAARENISGVVGENIRHHYEQALANRRLNRLVDDLDLDCNWENLRLSGMPADRHRELRDFLRGVGLERLFPRVEQALKPEPVAVETIIGATPETGETLF